MGNEHHQALARKDEIELNNGMLVGTACVLLL